MTISRIRAMQKAARRRAAKRYAAKQDADLERQRFCPLPLAEPEDYEGQKGGDE